MARISGHGQVALMLLFLLLFGCASAGPIEAHTPQPRDLGSARATAYFAPVITTTVDVDAVPARPNSMLDFSPRYADWTNAPSPTGPSTPNPKSDTRSAGAGFALLEGILAVDSGLFANNPRTWGILGALVVIPGGLIGAFTDPKVTPAEPWLFLASAGPLVAYDLKVDTRRTSRGRIFTTNFVGLNAQVASSAVPRYLAGSSKRDTKYKLTYAPDSHGGRLFLTYRF